MNNKTLIHTQIIPLSCIEWVFNEEWSYLSFSVPNIIKMFDDKVTAHVIVTLFDGQYIYIKYKMIYGINVQEQLQNTDTDKLKYYIKTMYYQGIKEIKALYYI